MEPNKLESSSVDGTQLNLEALYQIAPSCFTEVKDDKTGELRHVVNFKTLRQLLGDNAVEDADEMYQFTWPGKQEARREAARPTTKTLRPMVEDSVDWDNTQNLYIEGDNLEVLKLLQKSYMGKVKMIYSVNDGDLVACFANDITENIVKAMADKQPLRVLFRDSCFARDDAKINVFETLKQLLDWSEEEAIKNIKVI